MPGAMTIYAPYDLENFKVETLDVLSINLRWPLIVLPVPSSNACV